MAPYPEKNSVIIMDNARIHHDEELVRLVESLGRQVEFLPPYSPDFNPIETAFSSIKAWIKRHRDFFDSSDDPVYALEVACAHITSNMANAFFNASIYSE